MFFAGHAWLPKIRSNNNVTYMVKISNFAFSWTHFNWTHCMYNLHIIRQYQDLFRFCPVFSVNLNCKLGFYKNAHKFQFVELLTFWRIEAHVRKLWHLISVLFKVIGNAIKKQPLSKPARHRTGNFRWIWNVRPNIDEINRKSRDEIFQTIEC